MKIIKIILPFIFFGFLISLWEAIVDVTHYPQFILPSPSVIFKKFIEGSLNGLIFYNSLTTMAEIIGGLFIGLTLAFFTGYLLSKSKFAEITISPIVVGFQVIPIVALAPIMVIWFGQGILTKIIISASTLFFPVLINCMSSFKNIDKNYRDLFQSFGSNSWQKLVYLELPASLPIILGSLKIGVVLSVIGAVVGEFVSSDKGLGFLINLAGGIYDTPLRFASFLALGSIAVILYCLADLLEKKLLKWRQS